MSEYDDFFGGFSNLSGKHSQYTVEEIEQAQATARKTGCTVMEALQNQTGRPLETGSARREQAELKAKGVTGDLLGSLDSLRSSLSGFTSSAASTVSDFFGSQTAPVRTSPRPQTQSQPGPEKASAPEAAPAAENAELSAEAAAAGVDDLEKQLELMNRHLQQDFGLDPAAAVASDREQTPSPAPEPTADLEAFDGVPEAVAESVFGQKAFLKKLTVAFKRPFVLPEEEGHARNCFFITGPENSGRHYALQQMTAELAKRRLLKSGEVLTMDLSVYTAAGRDNVFLQDLYMALQSKAQVLAFEGWDHCHISYLSYLSDLVLHGKCRLQDRYILQKGQLVNVSNSFASEAVSSFSAAGKYLVFLGTKGVDSLANVLGAPFVNGLGDICTAAALDDESFRAIAAVRWKALTETAEKQLGFVLKAEEDALCAAAVAAAGKNAGTAGVIGFFDNLLKALATMKLEGCYAKGTEVTLRLEPENGKLKALADGEELDLLANLPAAYTGEIEAVRKELDGIVGLKEVKEYILSLEEYYNTQKRRTEAGLKASEVSKHMIFTGNPGTGKTTIARIVSRYLKAIGVLSGGQLVEVSRADLVGRYVGHTAPLVNQVLASAIGGVLFIDEAYSLYRGREDSFGLEAIDTLVKGIEDHRDNLIVILAGYSDEMEEFLEANSGLRSRFPNFIDFPDYTGQELLEITRITVKSKGYTLDPATEDALLTYYNMVQATQADTAGNGRLVRNKVEEAILNQSRRLVAEPDADLSLLESRDFDFS